MWPPVKAKPVVTWLNVDGFQPAGVWQFSQRTGSPAATWFGFKADVKLVVWQELQSVFVPAKLVIWHFEQVVVKCIPTSGKPVVV